MCLWNEEYLFVGGKDNEIKLINLIKGNIVKELKGHNNVVVTIKKIKDVKYGEFLVSQGLVNDGIKIWGNIF